MRRLTVKISLECSKSAVISYFKSNEKAEREDVKENKIDVLIGY